MDSYEYRYWHSSRILLFLSQLVLLFLKYLYFADLARYHYFIIIILLYHNPLIISKKLVSLLPKI
jgi:hypothetical protein